MSKSFVLAGALALVALAGPALAADQEPSRVVHAAGVDFRDPAAVQALYQRIYREADTVCHIAQSDRQCIREAVSQAIAQVNRPTLTAMYKAGYGGFRRSDRGDLGYATR